MAKAPRKRQRDPLLEIPGARANPIHAVQLGFWVEEEAAAFLMGYDRTFLNRATTEAGLKGTPIAAEFLRRIELIERAIAVGDLTMPLRPKACVVWALERGLEVPPQLVELATGCSAYRAASVLASLPSSDPNPSQERSDPNMIATNVVHSSRLSALTQKLNTAQRIINGFLRAKYGLVAGEASEGDMGQPVSDLKSFGVPVDRKTLLRHFLEGSGQMARRRRPGIGTDSE